MSDNYSDDPIAVAEQAERDLNSYEAKTGRSKDVSDSTNESGIDAGASSKFPGSSVEYGSAASGAGDNREIPDSEGGGINPDTGRQTKARDFEGQGGPEEKMRSREEERGGDQDVQGNVRQDRDPSYTSRDVQQKFSDN